MSRDLPSHLLKHFDLAKAINLTEAAKLMRGRGAGSHPHPDTVRRWADPARGYRPRGHTGPSLVLMAIRVSGDWLTLPEWVEAFEAARVRAGQQVRCAEPRERPPTQRAAAHRRAEERLDKGGVK